MAPGNRGKGCRTKYCRQRGDGPIDVGAVQRAPVRPGLQRRGKSHLQPDRTQCDQKNPVHDAFQMGGQSHSGIGEMLFNQPGEQA